MNWCRSLALQPADVIALLATQSAYTPDAKKAPGSASKTDLKEAAQGNCKGEPYCPQGQE